MNRIESFLDYVRTASFQSMRHELDELYAIKKWGLEQAGIDYAAGDTVTITSAPNTDNDWRRYAELLRPGRTGTVRDVVFSTGTDHWMVSVGFTYTWSALPDRMGGITRYWHGPADITPEGFIAPSYYDQQEYPQGRTRHFMLYAGHLRKAEEGEDGRVLPGDPHYDPMQSFTCPKCLQKRPGTALVHQCHGCGYERYPTDMTGGSPEQLAESRAKLGRNPRCGREGATGEPCEEHANGS